MHFVPSLTLHQAVCFPAESVLRRKQHLWFAQMSMCGTDFRLLDQHTSAPLIMHTHLLLHMLGDMPLVWLQGEDRWDSGPEEGGLAKSHAARLLSELAGYEKLHGLMVRTGAAEAIADRGEELVSSSSPHLCCACTILGLQLSIC